MLHLKCVNHLSSRPGPGRSWVRFASLAHAIVSLRMAYCGLFKLYPATLNECGDQLRSNQIWLGASSPSRLGASRTRIVRLSLLSGLIGLSLLASKCALSQDGFVPTEANARAVDVHAQLEPGPNLDPQINPISAGISDSPTIAPAANTPAPEVSLLATALRQPLTQDQTPPQPAQPSFFKRPVKSEIIVEGLVSYGNYKIFASGYDMKLFTAGVEYDRHSWGYFLKAQVDYVAEFLPFVLLDKPLCEDIYGNPCGDIYSNPPVTIDESKKVRQFVPGMGISPIGFRMLWRPSKKIQPYLEAKGGILGFTHKVPSSVSSYENFTLQSAMGAEVKMNARWGLRLGLFSDFHFSNAFVVPVNPGLDVMSANLGLSYHFGAEK